MNPLFLIKVRKCNPILLYSLLVLYIRKLRKIEFTHVDSINTPIDVLIPTISKDFELLESVVKSLHHVKQPIHNIYIVSKNEDRVVQFCKKHSLIFVDENTVLGYGKDSISYTVRGVDRSGWIFQQLLKLSGDTIVETENYLVIDSDTILIRDFSFIDSKNRISVQQSYEWHNTYFKTYTRLFKQKPINTFSTIAHMMLFNKKILQSFKKTIEKIHTTSWDKAILSLIDTSDGSYFSEYESYINYIMQTEPEKIHLIPFYNTSYPRNKLEYALKNKNILNAQYNSISFHDYLN
jgi:hypothetical protein